MIGFASMTSKNQVTLPADLVRMLNWTAGTDFLVKSDNQKIILEKIPTISELREEVLSEPKVKKINAQYNTSEIVRLARQMKPPKNTYEH